MGYDLHITRAEFHATNEGHEITAEEWMRYVESDPELQPTPGNGEYFVHWSGKSKYPDPWLDWFRGNIYSKNPDKAVVGKMLQIPGGHSFSPTNAPKLSGRDEPQAPDTTPD